jgi:5-oxoprolinase (ATP-hydrolysing)
VLLLTTRGFRDALRIAYQVRPDIFAKEIVLPEQLYERVVEVDERVRADGTVVQPLDVEGVRSAIGAARREGFDAVAIVFMHAWKYPAARGDRGGALPRGRLSHRSRPAMRSRR